MRLLEAEVGSEFLREVVASLRHAWMTRRPETHQQKRQSARHGQQLKLSALKQRLKHVTAKVYCVGQTDRGTG